MSHGVLPLPVAGSFSIYLSLDNPTGAPLITILMKTLQTFIAVFQSRLGFKNGKFQ